MQLNLEQLRPVVLKKLAHIALVITLAISGLGILGTPAIADSHPMLATAVNRQGMAGTQNRASNYAQSKQELDQKFESAVTDVTEDLQKAAKTTKKELQKAANTTVETVKEVTDVDPNEVNSSAKQSQNRATR